MWYTAHAILFYKYCDGGDQTDYHVCENIYSIRASDHAQAVQKATEIASAYALSLTEPSIVGGRNATLQFASVRKTISIYCPDSSPTDLVDGCELTYLEIFFESKEHFDTYVAGERAWGQID